jgi:ribonuclease H / adenosylcobalamin/alpha-ribazole phosphatase
MAYYIYCDGGSKDNQDPGKRKGYGSFIVTRHPYPDHEAGTVGSKFFTFGNVTNNQAEYKTLIEALEYCIQEFYSEPIIYTDSELVVSQLNGTYKTKDSELKYLREAALKDIRLIKATVEKAPRETIFAVLGH